VSTAIWRKTTRSKLAMQNGSRKEAFEDGLLNPLPDVLLPSQFFESVGAQTFSCEQRLMLAILADAINVLGSTDSSKHRKRNSFNEAWSWVFTERMTSSLSFDHVCDALGINAESLRRRLSELVSEHGGSFLRLRLKEAGRMQRPTVIRVRSSRRRARTKTGKAPQTPIV
jgi:hypothetical protein